MTDLNLLNIAVVGDGRTGQEVVRLIENASNLNLSAVFNEDRPVDVAGLTDTDVAIVFVPPTAMDAVVPVLIESGVDVVCGTTGYHWTRETWAQINATNARWVLSHNFSLGMTLVRRCLEILGQSQQLYGQPQYHIREIHHTNKLDAPSGTAISWRDWLQVECDIESQREGDVKGIHELQVSTEFEHIELRHEAKDRALFAQGAIWAASNLGSAEQTQGGVHQFAGLVDRHLARPLNSAGA